MSNNHLPTIAQLRSILCSAATGFSSLDSMRNTTAKDREELQNILTHFLANPSISKLTAHPAHAPPHQKDKIAEIKSTLSMLTKSVNSLLQKKSNPPNKNPTPSPPTKAGGNVTPAPHSYAKTAATRPSRASLVMNLKDTLLGDTGTRPKPAYLTDIFNEALKASPLHQVCIAATWWTANGNLVITGGHMTTAQQLRDCTDTLATALAEDQTWSEDDPLLPPLTRPNVKWSKLLINGTPTGVLPDRAHAYSPEECHEALASENPYYSSLLVTWKPSWVRPPSQYTAGSSSSLVVAFEDPEGTQAKTLLAEKHLYAFGVRVTVKKWKQHSPKLKNPPPSPTVALPPPSPPMATAPPPLAATPSSAILWPDGTPV
jgi:hypothetical protein